MNPADIARKLGGEVSGGSVLAPGPGHSAADRSLSIKLDADAPDGFLTHSFAGNDPIRCRDYVRERCGMPPFRPNGGHRQRATARAARPRPQPTTIFNYTDSAGTPLYQVLRFDNPKRFAQRGSDGSGGWLWKLLDERRVLYRLPELLKYPDATVFFCEGERDADRVASLGHCATTVASGKWTPECVTPLIGRDVFILQDNDEAGAKRALEAARQLHGRAATIRIVLLPNLADGEDVSDWLDVDPRRAEKLVDICIDTPLWTPSTDEPADEPPATPLRSYYAEELEQQPVEPVEWIVENFIPAGTVSGFFGDGGTGKDLLLFQLGTAATCDQRWLGREVKQCRAMYFPCEDDDKELRRRQAAIAEHYDISFADFSKRFKITPLVGEDTVLAAFDQKTGVVKPTLLYFEIKRVIEEFKPGIVILPNRVNIFSVGQNDDAMARQCLGLLYNIAIGQGCAVIMPGHVSVQGLRSDSGTSGTVQWSNGVRARIFLSRRLNQINQATRHNQSGFGRTSRACQ